MHSTRCQLILLNSKAFCNYLHHNHRILGVYLVHISLLPVGDAMKIWWKNFEGATEPFWLVSMNRCFVHGQKIMIKSFAFQRTSDPALWQGGVRARATLLGDAAKQWPVFSIPGEPMSTKNIHAKFYDTCASKILLFLVWVYESINPQL